jgi:hypothetical protein
MGFGVFSMIPMGPFTLADSIYNLPVSTKDLPTQHFSLVVAM